LRSAFPASCQAALLAAAFLMGAPDAASTLHCHGWMRLDSARKQAAVQRMIDEALQSHRARQYGISRGSGEVTGAGRAPTQRL
jgi:hypothetical protein